MLSKANRKKLFYSKTSTFSEDNLNTHKPQTKWNVFLLLKKKVIVVVKTRCVSLRVLPKVFFFYFFPNITITNFRAVIRTSGLLHLLSSRLIFSQRFSTKQLGIFHRSGYICTHLLSLPNIKAKKTYVEFLTCCVGIRSFSYFLIC